ncbi:MAG: Sjogren's syndrome/scleroderma autoantigen 1 family protein [Halodesulfurarchaeum sp.]
MGENFDKEAERKRLREKYEADSADREVTERMSQLLLQGATMTNKHCDTCGSPIFRYQGQEFCPTCQTEADGAVAGAGADTGEVEAGAGAGNAEGGMAAAGDGDSNPPTQAAEGENSNGGTASDARDGTGKQSADESPTANAGHESVGTASTGTAELGGQPEQSRASGTSGGTPTTEAAPDAVTQSLAETIVSLSDRARESEDPNRAKKLLEAAREAAETLSRLQGN